MTQERINKYFQSSLGQQLDILYSTSDDRVFIRYHEEAVKHTEGLLDHGTAPLVDKTIETWYPEEDDEENERNLMREESKRRTLTEDERIIYNIFD